uniref:Succinate:cytochrome c oxidoreductase subunit 3 n=1 Tax=Chaetosphaeridium globosum TaxID=96477 RepID=Q8M1H1_CHAGL|nr:succinate:cytochrome c oxidoreductase subunit 3 [Chaetosphaeridium globosum]AAM96628.1 succinate:cytochrome c oxidoreductase subunit 3 [Chaetosphaeridium globosum]
MKINRPLSPHLTVYKPQLTSTLSIFHRISGAFLAFFVLSFALSMPICQINLSFYSFYKIWFYLCHDKLWVFLTVLNLAFFSVCYHMSNGIRHLLWDYGLFLDLSKVYFSGVFMLIVAVSLVILNLIRII